ncbi:hypothetical protein V1264_009017 [Littorina saxatilis]|uniref:F-box domain-containing protein n=1 Tax=Littorina saxatilis TaxID=31220 RepID=A0AAN9G1F7_9CAEN
MSGVSTTSTTTLKTDVTSKVLPGDKSGLPLEIWQIIFSYLSVRDLGCVTRVSKTWHDLALSIDMTRWKELYLACKEWRHPYWPLNVRLEPPSWKQAYRDQYLSTRFWRRCSRQAHKAGCMSLLKRSKERQNIQVGPGLQHETLKSAFAVANEYDRILVHPGIYDEQLEMTLKVPFELVGVGELGSVILVVCLEHLALTGRLSNLVLRAPWFSNFILKVRSGYVQVDNCIMEDGMMCVVNPASCHVQFCTLRHATVIMQHVNASIIRNCEFSQSDNANIVVEGYPKEDKSWAYTYLCQQTDEVFSQKQAQGYKNLLKVTDSTTSTLHSTFTGKSFTASTIKTYDTLSRGRAFSQECDYMNVSVVNSGVNGHAGGACGAAQSGVNVNNSGAHLCGMRAEARDVNGSRASGNTINVNRPVSSEDTTQQDIRNTVSHSTDVNDHEQNQCGECASDEGHGHLIHAETCCHRNNEEEGNDTDGGEWLEIIDERKPWQLEGEERKDRATKPQDLKSLEEPEEDCASPEHEPSSSATSKAGTSDTTQGASEKLFEKRDASQQGEAHNRLGEGGSIHKPTSYAKGDGETEHSPKHSDVRGISSLTAEAKKETGHSKNLGWDSALGGVPSTAGAGASTGESEITQGGEIVPQTHTVELHPNTGKGHLVNGDAFPQHLAALNKGDHSGDHDPNPPVLLNPHPYPLRPHSDLHPHQHHHHHHHPHPPQPLSHSANSPKVGDIVDNHPLPKNPLEAEREERRSQGSFHSSRKDGSSSEDDDDDLSILNDLESVGSRGSHHAPSSSSSEDEEQAEEELFRRDSVYDCSDTEESVIMLPHLRQKHLEASLSANAVNADVGSICSQASRPITFSATQDEGVMSYIGKVRGCLIHHCRMMHSKGGVMVSLQGHALISGCDISNVSYGVRCIQNSRVVILKNRIHHCRTSGIFMRLAASGLISGNDIHSNNEAGLDIRKNADPIVQHNRIHHGKRSGVVVLGSGRGHIRSNSIYSNTEAGIYILYGGNPTVSENTIYDGKAAGVAVNEGGQGYIFGQYNLLLWSLYSGNSDLRPFTVTEMRS